MATQAEIVPIAPVPGRRQPPIGAFVRRNGLQFGIVGVGLVIWIILIIAAPATFRSSNIYAALMSTVPFYGIVAIPMTLLVIAKEIDLSFVSIMSIGVVGFLGVFNLTHSALLAIVGCLAVGGLAGLLNGILVVVIGIPSLIATIGTQFFFAGLALVITNGAGGSMLDALPTTSVLHELLVGRLFGFLPAQMIWMILIAVVFWFLLNRHRFGAHIYLIGDNDNSARLMGINISQRRMLLFVLIGVMSAFAGLLASAEITYYYPTAGAGYLLPTLAAVFLGGTPVLGGVGTLVGTFVGCFIIGVIEPGTVAINLTGYWTQLIYGLVIVVSVAMHTILRRRIAR